MTSVSTLSVGTGSSVVVERCQVCEGGGLQSVLFLGYLPPVNTMRTIGQRPKEESFYPAEMLYCPKCQLVQLGLIVDPQILFPPEYPYRSGTTKILRDNFADLYKECQSIIKLGKDDLAVDIGSNDGTLLSNFKSGGHRVQGIEPTQMGKLAIENGIPTEISFFDKESATKVRDSVGKAKVITATNVFAHIENIHDIVDSILLLLADDGVFISESHYLQSLVETLQYDTIYHEHLRYYSLHSLSYLLNAHGLEVIHATRIPTHGGSIRVYAARKGTQQVKESVGKILEEERATGLNAEQLSKFKKRVVQSKLELNALLLDIKKKGQRVFAVGAPSRASTLVTYTALDEGVLDCVVEITGSYKIGKYMPGTLIPVKEESCLFSEQPDYALLLSWHITDELVKNLSGKGFKGKYIVPLPTPKILSNEGK